MQRMIINLLTFYWDHKDLFDDYELPSQVTKQDYIDRLLLECGELELYITNPNILKYMIGSWSRGKLPEWEKIADIRDLEYNPIWNVDGTTTHEEKTTGSQDTAADRTRSENWTESEENTTTNFISADNSESWSNDTKTEFETDKSGNAGETITDSESVEHETVNTWTDTRSGNIGVTTTQKMMTEEKEFWENYDLYGYLIKEFKQEFCLQVF